MSPKLPRPLPTCSSFPRNSVTFRDFQEWFPGEGCNKGWFSNTILMYTYVVKYVLQVYHCYICTAHCCMIQLHSFKTSHLAKWSIIHPRRCLPQRILDESRQREHRHYGNSVRSQGDSRCLLLDPGSKFLLNDVVALSSCEAIFSVAGSDFLECSWRSSMNTSGVVSCCFHVVSIHI